MMDLEFGPDGTGFHITEPVLLADGMSTAELHYRWSFDGGAGPRLLHAARVLVFEDNPAYAKAMWGSVNEYMRATVRDGMRLLLDYANKNEAILYRVEEDGA